MEPVGIRHTEIGRAAWGDALQAFTDRNAGRRTRLQIEGPSFSGREIEREYRLMGVAYDACDEQIQIMLGRPDRSDGHLTHIIADIVDVEIARNAAGRDTALRIGGSDRQTLLRVRMRRR
jgi:hypothetical protein